MNVYQVKRSDTVFLNVLATDPITAINKAVAELNRNRDKDDGEISAFSISAVVCIAWNVLQ